AQLSGSSAACSMSPTVACTKSVDYVNQIVMRGCQTSNCTFLNGTVNSAGGCYNSTTNTQSYCCCYADTFPSTTANLICVQGHSPLNFNYNGGSTPCSVNPSFSCTKFLDYAIQDQFRGCSASNCTVNTQTERIAQQAGVTIQQIIPKVIVAVMVITAMGQKERKNLIKF
uniref:Uncharacterized protein n=1 Tax=Meloidogyne floridensis TaxID=298350 RepID=A0A915NYD4_9BILA